MNSSHATCLLCLSMNKNTINFYSDKGKELNIISILSTHFWFQLDEIKVLSQNICCECWKKTESFHEFYQSIRIAHKECDTVFVKIENDLDIEDDGDTYQAVVQVPDDSFIKEFFKIENIEDVEIREEEDESSNTSVCEIPHTNSIDTETRAFDILPEKTQKKYLNAYKHFLAWKTGENIDEECFSEAVMLEYFYYMKSKYKPSSLWAQYSMLRTTIQRNNNIDISYPEVASLLKKSAIGFRSQKYLTFQPDEIQRFFSEAKDFEFLAVKVIMIFLIYGVTHTDDLTNVDVRYVSEQGSVCVIKFAKKKTNSICSFTVENEYAACVQKYKQLRPANVAHDRFFLNYQKGKCTAQPIGKNKFRTVPKVIANFLKLEDAESYTCYSFRRESIPNKRKTSGPDSEQIHFERSNEATVTSTITGSIDTSAVTIAPTSTTANNDLEDAKTITFDVLPEKSREKYLRSYDNFMAWKTKAEIDKECFSEAIMLEYFSYLKTKYKPTSLWAFYSMLRTTIQKNDNIDISYPELRLFLKTSSFAYLPRKSSVFGLHEIQRFLCEADDIEYLAAKVVMIFGISGIIHAETFTKVSVTDVIEQGSVFVIKIPDPKTNISRSFTVENEYAEYVHNYKKLRPTNVPHGRFFLNYQNGKCTAQPIGKNKFSNTPKAIANFLNLKDVENYTLHSFRRKSLKRGERSSTVVDSYIKECYPKKQKIGDLNSEQIDVERSTDAVDTSPVANQICEDAKATAWDLLPGKSREKYVRAYDNFLAWKTDEKIDKECFSEAIMLKYFNYLKTTYKPTSLWTEYSKLKATIQKNDIIDISYPSLRSFLRTTASGYLPQKCNVFHPDEIRRFLYEAEDKEFLAMKVIMIFGLYGATSACELTKVEVNDVSEQGSVFVIKIPDTKTNVFRSFIVENEYAAYVQKYKNLRPKKIEHRRFFIHYENGKCTNQVIGQNKLANTPKAIANFLQLEDADNYGGHSFRKTSKKLLADGSVDILTNRYCGSSTSSAVDSYTGDPISQFNFQRSTIQNTSTITNSMVTPIVANAYHVQPHQNQLVPYSTNIVNRRADNVHLQPRRTHPPPLLPFNTTSDVIAGTKFNSS